MKLNELEIYEDDFDLFVALDARDKIEFLFDAMQVGLEEASIKQVSKLADKYIPVDDTPAVSVQKYSNSLKAIRRFISKLWNDGIILSRLDSTKTDFDVYRFLRVYRVIGKGQPFSNN